MFVAGVSDHLHRDHDHMKVTTVAPLVNRTTMFNSNDAVVLFYDMWFEAEADAQQVVQELKVAENNPAGLIGHLRETGMVELKGIKVHSVHLEIPGGVEAPSRPTQQPRYLGNMAWYSLFVVILIVLVGAAAWGYTKLSGTAAYSVMPVEEGGPALVSDEGDTLSRVEVGTLDEDADERGLISPDSDFDSKRESNVRCHLPGLGQKNTRYGKIDPIDSAL